MAKKCAPKIRKKMNVGGPATYTYDQLIQLGMDDAEATMYLQGDTSDETKKMLLSKYDKKAANTFNPDTPSNEKEMVNTALGGAASYAATGTVPYAAVGKLAGAGVKAFAANEDKDKDFTNLSAEQHALSSGLEYAGYGAAIGTMITPGIGTAIGAGVGALAGTGKGLYDDKMENKKIEQNQNQKKAALVKQNTETAWAMSGDRSGANRLKDGGKVVGKGTAKSDSINASLPEGSFIVPAENAKKAEKLRALYLGGAVKKAELKDGGGVPVKLSNGEHMFTPEEVSILQQNGVDLNALAPNAEEGNELKEGGDVKKYTDKEINDLVSNVSDLKSLAEKIKKIENKSTRNENELEELKRLKEIYYKRTKNLNPLEKTLYRLDSEKFQKVTQNTELLKKNLNKKGEESLNTIPTRSGKEIQNALIDNAYNEADKEEQQNLQNNQRTTQQENVNNQNINQQPRQRQQNVSKNQAMSKPSVGGKSNFANPDEILSKSPEGRALLAEKNTGRRNEAEAVVTESSRPMSRAEREGIPELIKKYKEALNSGDAEKGSNVEDASDLYDQIVAKGFDPASGKDLQSKYNDKELSKLLIEYDELKVKNDPKQKQRISELEKQISDKGYDLTNREFKKDAPQGTAALREQAEQDGLNVDDSGGGSGVNAARPKNYSNALGLGLSAAMGATQIALAQNQFDKIGERPVYQMDQALTQATQAQMQDANVGLTDWQMNQLRNNEALKTAALSENIVQQSGGNAGVALANLRGVGLDSNQTLESMYATNEEIKMKKRAAALDALGSLERRKREIFTDELSAFDQNQKAAAELMQSGFHNIAGASRYKTALDYRDKAENERTAWTKDIQNLSYNLGN